MLIFMVGNKIDLQSVRQVSFDEGKAIAKDEDVGAIYETSAKEGTNVDKLFTQLGQKLLERGLGGGGNVNSNNNNGNTSAAGGAANLKRPLRPGEVANANNNNNNGNILRSTCC